MTGPNVQAEPAPAIMRSIIGGVLMGLANLVPGISGGTMLLAAGVYPQFINGVAEVTTFRFRLRTIVPLGCIVMAAIATIVALAGPVAFLVEEHRWIMYAIFIGLTLGGVPVVWKLIDQFDASAAVAAVVGVVVMAAMAFVEPAQGGGADGSHPYLLYFLAGLAGASAMVLPGVSGAYLLLILGQYVAILTAVSAAKDGVKSGDWAAVMDTMHVIVPVGMGVVTGVVGISNLVRLLLTKLPRPTLGFLLGLLLGAILGLWPFQESVAGSEEATELFRPSGVQILVAVALIAAGCVGSWSLAHFGRRKDCAD
jgi:putative membrane protein